MKLKNLASIAALLLATLTAARAQTNTLVGWSFDNLALGANSSPAAAANTGTASTVGLTAATVVAQSGSSTGSLVGTNAWKVGGGWNTNNAIGSQGVQFTANSVGYYQVQVSFDIYAATNAEALLQVQYSPNGNTWFNANLTSAGSLGILATNTNPTNGIVIGTYLVLTNSGGVAAWDNGVKVDLSGVSWVDNNPNLAIRIVNAAKGTNCVATTGAKYSSNANIGDWTFDNVVIQGVPFDAAAVWTFEGLGILSINNPPPAISNATATATCFGFNVTNTLMGSHSSGKDAATNAADILANGAPYSSTGSGGQNVWRLRGQPGNGWLSVLPIGSQGAEFRVDTTGYTNMILTFDIEFTAQSEAKMCVEYTTNNWATTNVANSLAYAVDPTYIMTNTPAFTSGGLNLAGNATYSANTVNGTLLFNTFGAIFFNNVVVDLTGVPNVANNSHFAFRIVNAATGADCVNGIYGPYNNTSGNCRVDNIAVNGKYEGSIAPTVTAQSSPVATVDQPFTNTFSVNADWSSKISSIVVNGLTLPSSSYAVTSSNIIYTPSAGVAALTTAGTDYITIYATNYTSAKVTQVVGPGVYTQLYFVQPVGPSASGGTLTVNPSFTCVDQFTNPTALTYPNMQVVATVSNSPATWALGGSITQAIYNGACTFSNLSAAVTGSTAISNAAITFTVTSGPITVTNSTSFIIGAPPVSFTPGNLAVIQSDISGANSTLSIIEVKPSAAGQTSPVNIIPITATGTNALRMVNAGSGGHLALSDDGTKLVFAGYADDNSATPDETFNLNRGVGTLDYTNAYVLQAKYVSSSYGGSQARAACSPDNSHYLIDDKGGLYIADNGNFYYNLYNQNNISTKSFGGVCWVATAKTTPASPTASVFIFSDNINANGVGLDYTSDPQNNPDSVFNVGHTTPAADSFTQDFYMVSTNGNDYSILYVLDASVTSGVGAITKYKMSGTIDTDFTWVQQGSTLSLKDNGLHLFATTNGSGSVYLFFVNGKNQIIRLTDQTAGGPLTIVSSNTIYTATSGNIQGLTFAPQQTGGQTELIPAPVAQAQTPAFLAAPTITITNNLTDVNWLPNVTSISVNGTVLTTGFNTNTLGKIVFTNAAVGFVQGANTIAIAATGYSTNVITQILIGNATQLVMATEPTTPWVAGVTNLTPPVLYIEDSTGDIVTTNNSTVVTATVGTGTGPLTGTLTATAVNGVVTFTALKAPALAQTGLLLTFTSPGLASAVDTTSITVTVGAASKLVMKTAPSSTVAAASVFATAPQVYIEDAFGNVVTTATSSIVATVGSGTGPLTGTRTNAAVAGVATFSALAAPTLAQTGLKLTFTNSTLTSVADTTSITVTAAGANKLAITTQPTAPVVNGGVLGTQPVVVVQDQYGNTVTTATSNIVAQVGAGAWTIGGTTANVAVSGVSTYTDLTAKSVTPVTGATIAFASTGLTGVTSAGFNLPAPVPTNVVFLGVAAGDASSSDVMLWTRALDTNAQVALALVAQVSTNSAFSSGVTTWSVNTDTTKDYTAKLNVTGLTPNTKYYYNFVFTNSSVTNTSITGTFKTPPAANTATPVTFAFSGDYDGLMRPYTLGNSFTTNFFDFFMNIGDTIYETASSNSAAVTASGAFGAGLPTSSTGATMSQLYTDYTRKYREQFIAVNAGGQNCLQDFFAAQGNYTLLDNHELGNKQYMHGGAAAGGTVGDAATGRGVDPAVTANDVNTSGTYMNKTPGFTNLIAAYTDYQPIKNRGLISASTDPRTDGTQKLYMSQQWGKNAILINTDTRSYRDIRMRTSGNAEDTGSRADNASRTYFGATQLAWIEQSLLDAQNNGTPWKFVAISDPIDQIGPIGSGLTTVTAAAMQPYSGNASYSPVNADGGKALMGGYRAERNALLKFIADNQIRNVVFLTTDDHQNRINEVLYSTNGVTGTQSSYVKVPYCFEVVDGPFGATGPDLFTNHDWASVKGSADLVANAQISAGVDPIGLATNYLGLHDVMRDQNGVLVSETTPQAADFYSPDTFNYNVMNVSADGKTLTVKSVGINSYAQNNRVEAGTGNQVGNSPRTIFSFQVDAADPINKIDHFIVVYQENWSFDALYGSFPGANGIANASAASLNQLDRLTGVALTSELGVNNYNNPSKTSPLQNTPPQPLNGNNNANIDGNFPANLNTLVPYDISSYVASTNLTGDIFHRYWQEQYQIDHGTNDLFVTWSDNPGLVMSHYDASQMPEGKLAQQYIMCDNFFHSAFGGSFLNHQFLIAAAAPVYNSMPTANNGNIALLDANGLFVTNSTGASAGKYVRDGSITPVIGDTITVTLDGVSTNITLTASNVSAFTSPGTTYDKHYVVNTTFSANLQSHGGSTSAVNLLPSLNNTNPAASDYVQNIGDKLDAASVSWKWYSGGWNQALLSSPNNPITGGAPAAPTLFQWHHQPFAYFAKSAPFADTNTYADGRNPYATAHLQDETNFYADIASNTLPAVSFVKFLGPDNEHPGYTSLLQGQQHVADLVAQVQANPALWAHTAIIITYDEHGGRWDHVAPPTRDIWGPGVRVPAIIISPYAKTNSVDHTAYDTTSILTTIEHRFGVTPINSLDATAPTLLNSLTTTVSDPATAPTIAVNKVGNQLALSWPGVYLTYVLQSNNTSLLNPAGWVTVPGVSNNSALFNLDNTQTNVFFRLIKQ